MGASDRPLTPATRWAVALALAAIVFIGFSQVWVQTSTTWGPLVPLLAGLGIGCAAGVLGVVSAARSTRTLGAQRDTALSVGAAVVGLVCLFCIGA